MSRDLLVESDEYEVIDACRKAATRLQYRPRGVASEKAQLGSLVGDLLDAVGTALAMRPGSVPQGVQRAAFRVAQHVQARCERNASAGGHRGRHGGRGEVRPDAGRNSIDGDRAPFTASIRLGRMG